MATTERKLKSAPSTQSAAPRQAPSTKAPNPLLSEGMVRLLNYRIEQEEFSSRFYMAMAMWLTNEGYLGAGKLWRKYSDEEMGHAEWARTHILSFGVQPLTPKLEMPQQTFSGLPQIIQLSYNHEITVSAQIKKLAGESLKEGDFMVHELALRYLKEQVEEHDKMQNWMDRLSAFGTDTTALRFLDNEMGEAAEG